MKVSVIIPAYNEEDEIVDCLESLGNQRYKGFEIIVVDDGSSDRTRKRVNNLSRKIPLINLLTQKHKGPGGARNLGAKHARGEILVFVDADMTFESDFIKKLVDPIVKGKVKGTFSKDEYIGNWDNIWARCWNINQNWPDKKRHPKNYPDEDKVFRAILKSEFDKVGGFTPGGYTDDYSLSEKLELKAYAASGAKFYHKNPETLTEIFKHAKWVGKRTYKLGYFGYLVGLTRASLPVSIVIGLLKSIINIQPAFIIFKIVYDFGIFLGILEYIITGKGPK